MHAPAAPSGADRSACRKEPDAFSVVWRIYGHPGAGPAGQRRMRGRDAAQIVCRRFGLDGNYRRVGLAVLCGVMVAQAFGSHDAASTRPSPWRRAVLSGNLLATCSGLWSAQLLGGICGASLMALHYAPHWSHTPDQGRQTRHLLHRARSVQARSNLVSEIVGTMVLVIVAGAIFSPRRGREGPRRRHRAMAGLQPCLGHWPLAGRHHRLCDQSRARPGPAPRACAAAHSRQRRFQLALRRRPHLGPLLGGALAGLLLASRIRA